ncbi:TonB-dependent receptor plug domain-containing protein [Kordiimonas marina]|uniref:TonB-dependent receptor plug domain-containing protein n=1 Tax=Kordiimonas marina TaxID=2872312 RepID=UPI001FF2FE16|nr:TonB-dependent receptor [Kordiimonas marina]MCJ9430082.1 TonB-dependent receptor [Kordiimonas marina]
MNGSEIKEQRHLTVSRILSSVSAVALLGGLITTGAIAQDQTKKDEKAKKDVTQLEEIVTVGTRSRGRSALDSPAPIDVISGSDFENQSSNDMSTLLRTVVPSYNVSAQPISDASTFVRPASLRGLAADHTLVLLNGKRRHRSAVINFYTAGDSNGAQGPDISVFPPVALKQVEVLRDGAAAQYGSDAIAGVMNFKLKDDNSGGTLEAKYGSTYAGDGDNLQVDGNVGLPFTSEGFVNLSASYSKASATDRSVQRADAAALTAAGIPDVPNPAQVWGSPKVDYDIKLIANMGVDLSDTMHFYAFGNFAKKKAENGLYYRNPNSRAGVYTTGSNALVADLDGIGTGISCPSFAAGDAAGLALISDNSTAVGANCFAFNEIFPGGFTPSLSGVVTDMSGVAGLRGTLESGMTYDVSFSAGTNKAAFTVDSINASYGPNTPRIMRAGTFRQSEQDLNVDLTYPVPVDAFYGDLMLAGGFEWRNETFEADAGDPESYDSGPLADQGFSGGSQGYVGLSNQASGVFSRSNIAFYLDSEAEIAQNFLLTGAVRWEHFQDFGDTANVKFSGRYDLTDWMTLRASYSTGFRAPTPGQANIVNVSSVLQNGVLVNSGIIPPTTPLAEQFGGKPLGPEKSNSYTIGTVLRLGGIDLTVDYFNVNVNDRITVSSFFSITSEEAALLESQGISGATSFANFRYYTNDFSTNTKGIDVVATKSIDWDEGVTNISLSANWTKTKVKHYTPGLLDNIRIRTLEEGMPHYRGNLTVTHHQGKWRGLARLNYYGKYFNGHLSYFELTPGAEMTVDLEVGYDVTDHVGIVVGASNLFNNYPDLNPYATGWGAKYPEFSPMGINGGSYYARLRYTFD